MVLKYVTKNGVRYALTPSRQRPKGGHRAGEAEHGVYFAPGGGLLVQLVRLVETHSHLDILEIRPGGGSAEYKPAFSNLDIPKNKNLRW